MISEEDKDRCIEASNCKDCIGWLKHCDAECCKIIFLNINEKDLERGGKLYTLKPKNPLSLNDQRYYKLRDVECIRGLLRFRKDRIFIIGRKIMYIHPCKHLKDNLCEIQNNYKPDICSSLTLETAKLPGQPFELTDNCLFKYKCKGVE